MCMGASKTMEQITIENSVFHKQNNEDAQFLSARIGIFSIAGYILGPIVGIGFFYLAPQNSEVFSLVQMTGYLLSFLYFIRMLETSFVQYKVKKIEIDTKKFDEILLTRNFDMPNTKGLFVALFVYMIQQFSMGCLETLLPPLLMDKTQLFTDSLNYDLITVYTQFMLLGIIMLFVSLVQLQNSLNPECYLSLRYLLLFFSSLGVLGWIIYYPFEYTRLVTLNQITAGFIVVCLSYTFGRLYCVVLFQKLVGEQIAAKWLGFVFTCGITSKACAPLFAVWALGQNDYLLVVNSLIILNVFAVIYIFMFYRAVDESKFLGKEEEEHLFDIHPEMTPSIFISRIPGGYVPPILRSSYF